MKTHINLSIALFTVLFFLCFANLNAQSCKQAFYSAKEQYNGGQFKSAQNLLHVCMKDFSANKDHYRNNPDQVYKVYKLYIASCSKEGNTSLANSKRNELVSFLGKGRDEVINKLNSTSL